MQSVIKGPQIGIHFLLEIPRKEAQALPRFNRRPGEHQTLHLALGQHAHGQHRGQKRLAGSGRPEREGEIVALHRLHVGLLPEGAGPQQVAALILGQHLLAHGFMFPVAARVERLKSRLQINR